MRCAVVGGRDNSSTDGGQPSLPERAFDPQADFAASSYDIRHTFNGAFTLIVPAPKAGWMHAALGDWSLDGQFLARSAAPINITSQRDIGFGTTALRPDFISGVSIWLDDASALVGEAAARVRRASQEAGSLEGTRL